MFQNNNKKFIYNSTIRSVFNKINNKFPKNIFLSSSNIVKESFREYSYADVKKLIIKNKRFLEKCELYSGARVGVMIGNCPEFFILKLSLNYYGMSCIPLNNELTFEELSFIINNAKPKYIIFAKIFTDLLDKTLSENKFLKVGIIEHNLNSLKLLRKTTYNNKKSLRLNSKTESSILYTSGTTGAPKGCILTHEYEINAGFNYAKKMGLISFKIGKEKLYNCLPVHHVNAGVLSFFAMLITANCQIQGEKFSVKNFWKDIKLCNATIFHYLGVMTALLIKSKKSIYEKNNKLRLGVGAGIESSIHYAFEKRFKVAMVELWGMTEMVRCIFDYNKKRLLGKRCFGKVDDDLETKVVDSKGNEVIGLKGNFLIRFNKKNPKTGFFSGYCNNYLATKKAWQGGWFNTGDIVIKDKKGKHYFVERAKNIIRRSGENIAAAEVEQTILKVKYVINCAVFPKKHKYYEEEVFAFIVITKEKSKKISTAKDILKEIRLYLAHFKLPGYVKFCDSLPLTSSQKTDRKALQKIIFSIKENHYYNLEKLKRSLKPSIN